MTKQYMSIRGEELHPSLSGPVFIADDDMGYPRFFDKNGNSALVHRVIAFRLVYCSGDYHLPFNQYVVHHRDGDKHNFTPENLEVLLQEEHEEEHGIPSIDASLP